MVDPATPVLTSGPLFAQLEKVVCYSNFVKNNAFAPGLMSSCLAVQGDGRCEGTLSGNTSQAGVSALPIFINGFRNLVEIDF
jgi:hypothetical protein